MLRGTFCVICVGSRTTFIPGLLVPSARFTVCILNAGSASFQVFYFYSRLGIPHETDTNKLPGSSFPYEFPASSEMYVINGSKPAQSSHPQAGL